MSKHKTVKQRAGKSEKARNSANKRETALSFLNNNKKIIIFHICWYVGMALLMVAFIQWRIGNLEVITLYPMLYLFSAVVMLLLLIMAHGVFGNPFLGTAFAWACLVLLTYADQIKYSLRMEHVYPSDLEMFFHLDELDAMYDSQAALPQWFIAFGILAAGIVATILIIRRRKGKEKRPLWQRIFFRLMAVVVGFALLYASVWPIVSPDMGDIDFIEYDYIAWNQPRNYDRNGFVVAFISNLKEAAMEEPDGYSEARVAEIAERYREIAAEGNRGRDNLAYTNVDIIYIMNESFSDPDRFAEHYPFTGLSDELVPNLHEIYEKSASGWMYSSRYGGGTANIEFEAFTGFSTYFTGFAYPYQSMLPSMTDFPSIAQLMNSHKRSTIGLHSYAGAMYRRNVVYPILGFDAFYGSEDYHYIAHDRESTYISDESSYNEAKLYLKGVDGGGNSNENYFVTLVTMQNHPQYGSQYDAHSFFSLADVTYNMKKKIEDYMELIHSSDKALGDFIDWVDQREKRTVVVFFGDHLPGIYENLFAIDMDLAYETPFFIYKNYDEDGVLNVHLQNDEEDEFYDYSLSEEVAQEETEDEQETLPTVSANYLPTVVFDYLNARKPPWYYLLDDVMEDTPILTSVYWQDSPPEETQALLDYQMISYDMLKGKKYAEKYGLFEILDKGQYR